MQSDKPNLVAPARQSEKPNLVAPARRSGGAPAPGGKSPGGLNRAVPDPLFTHRRGASTEATSPPRRKSRKLTVLNLLALLAIAGAVAFQIAQAGMPAVVLQEEGVVIVAGIVYGALALWIRSTPLAG